jgi:hypothetical protein
MVSSTELIQEEEAAEQHTERNPEMKVGGDGAKQITGTGSLAGRHCSLGMEFADSGVPS